MVNCFLLWSRPRFQHWSLELKDWCDHCYQRNRFLPVPARHRIRAEHAARMKTVAAQPATQRLRITLRGAVQGVGFRPFVYRLATEMALTGWVLNSSAGLVVEVEGPGEQLTLFEQRLEQERPRASVVDVREFAWLAAEGSTRFEILASDHDSGKTVNVLPDLATCTECREELFDPENRRFLYPFTNCTNCGPRYTSSSTSPTTGPTPRCAIPCVSAIAGKNTKIPQPPLSCAAKCLPRCGPQLDGTIEDAVIALREGEIVALKGVGGFQLLVDARNLKPLPVFANASTARRNPSR